MNWRRINILPQCRKLVYENRVHIFACLQALALTYACYVAGNIPYSTGGEKQSLRWFDTIVTWATGKDRAMPADVLAINVSYDKALVDVADDFGLPLGVTDITDRGKLLRLLSLIDSVGGYRHVICDIVLSSRYATGSDSALLALAQSMPRITFSAGLDEDDLPAELRDKAFYSGYNTTIDESDFVKFPLFHHGRPSLPLHVWTTVTGHTLRGNTFLSLDNEGEPARRALFLDFPVRAGAESGDMPRQWLNMGTDILDVAHMIDIADLLRDKTILIGSFTDDDIHSTLAGDMPGVMIIYNAYHALESGRHRVSIAAMAALWIVFYAVTILMIRRKTLSDLLPARLRPRRYVWRVALSWLSLSTLFAAVLFVLYLVWGQVCDILIISGYFTIFGIAVDGYHARKIKK